MLKIRSGPGDNGLPNLTQNKNNQTQNQWTRVIKFGWHSFIWILINLRTQLDFNTYYSSNKTISIYFKQNHSREEGLEKGFWGWKETRHQHCCHRYDHYHRRMHCCQTCRQFETTQNFHNKVWKKLTCGFDFSLDSIAESRLVIIHFGNHLVSGIVIVMILTLVLWRSQLEID